MKSAIHLFLLTLLAMPARLIAQKGDTVKITASQVNTNVLIEGTHRYPIYFKNGKDSSRKNYQIWTRKIERVNYQGQKAIQVTQEWENNDTVIHKVFTVFDTKSFAPRFQESWTWQKGTTTFDFASKTGAHLGLPLTENDTARARKRMLVAFREATTQYVLDWHLDMEVLPTLPYKENTTFLINFYDPGFNPPKCIPYTVTGSSLLTGYDNQLMDCWLLVHDDGPGKHEVFWISKKTKEVLKLEQEFNGRFRYKIKLPFSN